MTVFVAVLYKAVEILRGFFSLVLSVCLFIRPESPVQSQVSGSMMLDQLPLAMAYVPMQMWGETYEGLKALDVGTIFPDLNLPFCGRRLSE